MTRSTLCIFTRAPVLGAVKRRLAAEIGAAAALRAHCELLQHALRQLSGLDGVATQVWVAGPAAAVTPLLPAGIDALRTQCDGDLGTRMCDALRRSLAETPRAVVVGSDCPDLDGAYVVQALAALDACDVVVGPAEDGGYGLIGVARTVEHNLPVLFEGVPWGTDRVLEITLERAAAASLSVTQLREIWDVDDAADWRRFLAGR